MTYYRARTEMPADWRGLDWESEERFRDLVKAQVREDYEPEDREVLLSDEQWFSSEADRLWNRLEPWFEEDGSVVFEHKPVRV